MCINLHVYTHVYVETKEIQLTWDLPVKDPAAIIFYSCLEENLKFQELKVNKEILITITTDLNFCIPLTHPVF
jgi:hypothetical protein